MTSTPSYSEVLYILESKYMNLRQVPKGRKKKKKAKNKSFEDILANSGGMCDSSKNDCVCGVLAITTWTADKIPQISDTVPFEAAKNHWTEEAYEGPFYTPWGASIPRFSFVDPLKSIIC